MQRDGFACRLGRWKDKYSAWLLLSPYLILFTVFIVVPVVAAILLSFTRFNGVQTPRLVGVRNYVELFTQDEVFMKYVLPNTVKYALIVGPGGYILSFFLAWVLAQLTKWPRTILAIIIYSPSMTAGVTMSVMWKVLFSGDRMGYINNLLLQLGAITEPLQFLTGEAYLMPIMIVVSLWSSMGVGFLAMLAGVLNVNAELYEAAYIDGVHSRLQEIIYITIPTMLPQMLFGAVMAIVNTFSVGYIGVQLSGSNPTPGYAGQLMINHIEDYGYLRYEMGYAAAVSVVLLAMIWSFSKLCHKLLGDK